MARGGLLAMKQQHGCPGAHSEVAELGLCDGKLGSVGEHNLHKEYAEKGALFVDACRDSPKTGTGKLIKRMMEVGTTKSYKIGRMIYKRSE